MNNSITVKKAKEAIQNLKKLTPANPKLDDDLEMTVKETVFLLALEFAKMTKRGFTIKALSDGLAAEGVHIKPGTLNRYLNEFIANGNLKPGGKKVGAKSDSSPNKQNRPEPGDKE